MKVLFYATNGLGMGHLNRTLVIARALRSVAPETQIEFIVGSPVFNMVKDSGFSVTKVADIHHPLSFLSGLEKRQVHMHRVFEVLLEHFQPDVFIGDFVVNDGLFKLIQEQGSKLCLILRKQRPEILKALHQRRCMTLVDQFLLPHTAQELELRQLPRDWRHKCTHLGSVGRQLIEADVAPTRARFAEPTEKLVVVTIGGGGSSEAHPTIELAKTVSTRLSRLKDGSRVRWVLVHGPYYSEEIEADTKTYMTRRYEMDLLPLMAGADVVICNAGYNTLHELSACGTPAVLIPLANTGRDDQFERAKQAEAQGRALVSERSADALEKQVRAVLENNAVPRAPAVYAQDDSKELGSTVLRCLLRVVGR